MSVGVSVLGSTGSVGETTLRVIREMGGAFRVVGLAAGSRVERLMEQIEEFSPEVVSVAGAEDARRIAARFPRLEVTYGPHGATQVADVPGAQTVVAAIVGAAGLAPTLKAVQRGKRVALANKEALVMAGRLVMEAARKSGAEILPVDSEHCAVFQCSKGESPKHIRRILLTASGGALRDLPLDQLEEAPPERVLRHPTWRMGRKITVDSATMMNKGLEVIEAHHLFGLPLEKISVLMHRESIVHSLVEFVDGSVLAQMAEADMALPVQYALTYPARKPGPTPALDLAHIASLSFAEPDPGRYPCLELARQAARTSEAHKVALNSANEEAVRAYLEGRISYGAIPRLIRKVLESTVPASLDSLEHILALDRKSRQAAQRFMDQGLPA
jgi:1-deoxy-D-xylulose-5-phosphate reductoisomerase